MGRGSSGASGGGGGGGAAAQKKPEFEEITNGKEFGPGTSGMNEADKFFAGTLDDLTGHEKSALTWYTGSGYASMNDGLRADDNKHPNRTKSMDSAMAKAELNEPIVVYRGSSTDLFGDFGGDWQSLVGKEVMDKGFMSTTVKKGGGFSGTRMRITVPPGKGRGMYVRPISNFPSEGEFLLNRGTKFRITSVTGSGYDKVVNMQVID